MKNISKKIITLVLVLVMTLGCVPSFTNVGNADIIISKVETSCGCTIPEYDKKPVAPGNVGTIRVRFDSSNKSGTQYKTIKLFSNCKDNEIFELVITGEVQDQE